MKGKLNTKNPYLLTYISTAIYRLEHCDKEFDHFMGYTRNLSMNATKMLQEESNQLLHIIRRLEHLIRPFEHDWVVVTQDIRDQCEAVLTTLFLVALDIWLIREIGRRAYSLVSVLSNSAIEQYSDVRPEAIFGLIWKLFEAKSSREGQPAWNSKIGFLFEELTPRSHHHQKQIRKSVRQRIHARAPSRLQL
jgi:hypothetical protein